MRHLSRIVALPFGVNIIGLMEVFAVIGIQFGAIALSDQISAFLGRVVGAFGLGAVMVFDLWLRSRQPEGTRWRRLFSPFAGGCFVFVPIWLLVSGACVAVTVAILLKNA
jgi:hypothetical protein